MGWSARFDALAPPALLLYAAAFCWTIGYDTIYALQDARDDAIVGIKSTARLFGRHGDFYRIAGHRIAEIDGFNPDTVKPFDEFAMLGPGDPDKACANFAAHLGHPVIIIDGNNINVEVLGMSTDMPVNKETARLVLLDNPMGQGEELTPFVVVHQS